MDEFRRTQCRVCLQDGEKFMSLHEKLEEKAIFEHMMSITTVIISYDDGLPDRLCPNCLRELQVAITFKKKCENADHILRNPPLKESTVLIKIKTEIDSNDEYFDDLGGFDCKDEIDQNSPSNFLLVVEKTEDKMEYKEVEVDNFIPVQDEENELIPRPARGQLFSPQCNECLQFFRSKCKLRVHWKKEHMNTMLTCQICKRVFKGLNAFNKHKNNPSRSCYSSLTNSDKFSIIGVGKSRTFKCNACEYTSKLYNHMHTHLVVHMPGVKPFKCEYCPASYTQRGSLYAHITEIHESKSKQTICSVCGQILISQRRLYRHMQRHRERELPCPECNLKFKTTHQLQVHRKRHGAKTYQCSLCPKKFFTQAENCNHRRMTHLKPKIKCQLCDYSCAKKESLLKHEAQHNGVKPYSCEKCGRFYDTFSRLQTHIAKYHRPKTLQCPFCDKLYTNNKSRRNHMKVAHELQLKKVTPEDSNKDTAAHSTSVGKQEPVDVGSDCSGD